MENKQRIMDMLAELEAEHEIQIIFAVECGSRAYGIHSKDSDNDVRFVYKMKDQSIYDKEIENFEESLTGDKDDLTKRTVPKRLATITEKDRTRNADYQGWELTKGVKSLMVKNPSIVEWCYSPIIYKNDGIFLTLAKSYIDRTKPVNNLLKHYIGFGGTYLQLMEESYSSGETEVKPLLGFIRCVMMALLLVSKSQSKEGFANLTLNLENVLNELSYRIGANKVELIKKIIKTKKNLKDKFQISHEFKLWLLNTFRSLKEINKKRQRETKFGQKDIETYFEILYYEDVFKYDFYKKLLKKKLFYNFTHHILRRPFYIFQN